MTGEPEMILLESDHGGVEVQERPFLSSLKINLLGIIVT